MAALHRSCMCEMQRKRRSALFCSLLHPLKCLALLLLAEVQEVHCTATPVLPENGAYDASSIFSGKSVSRIMPLLREVEAALRLKEGEGCICSAA